MKRGVLSVAAATLAAVVGCGDPKAAPSIATAVSSGAAPGPTATATVDPEQAQRRWAQCMREQGVDMPDPDPNEGKIIGFEWPSKGTAEADRMETAQRACRSFDTFSEATKPMSAEELTAWRAYARCMRNNGVEMSDPDPAGWPPMPDRDTMRNQRALLERAEKACQDLLQAARKARAES